jgi:hypothetical protein
MDPIIDPAQLAYLTWCSEGTSFRDSASLADAFRSGYRIASVPRRPRRGARPDEAPSQAAYIVWCGENDNTRYGSLNADAFRSGYDIAMAAGAAQSAEPEATAQLARIAVLRAELHDLQAETVTPTRSDVHTARSREVWRAAHPSAPTVRDSVLITQTLSDAADFAARRAARTLLHTEAMKHAPKVNR